MKSFVMLSFAILMAFGGMSCNAQATNNKQVDKNSISKKVEVYYFHYTRRCMTCTSVEAESKKAVEALYPEQVKNGTITFTSINLDDESSKAIAEKLSIGGQTLLVVCGEKKTDLTSQGFMNARSNPEKLKEEIKKAIDNMLI